MSDPSTQTSSQDETIRFLSDPASYAGHPDRIERRETHGALVFLAGEEVIKIKRAVRFSYMDFSTLEKRHAVCRREIEINARFAPEIYLGCISITREANGRLAFGGLGEVVEWAVRMRRFDEAAMLSRIAETRGIDLPLAKALADTVLASHQQAETAQKASAHRWFEPLVDSLIASIHTKDEALRQDQVTTLATRLRERANEVRAVVEARADKGFVRRCHGDLHLDNIVVWEGRPMLFDALEFDEDLATIDTLYDLAFLLMDLDFRDQRPAANVVLNRYLWRSASTDDFEGLAALPVFLALRAIIRARVAVDRSRKKIGNAREQDRDIARHYLEAGLAYLTTEKPRMIAIGGPSGTGKSTLGAALAAGIGRAPGAIHLRSDLERKSLAGVPETERLAPEWYSEAVTGEVYRILGSKARLALKAGQSVIVDAVHGRIEERAATEQVAAELEVPFAGLWLTAPADELMRRVAARRGDASDATPDVVRRQLSSFITDPGPPWCEINAGQNLDATLDRARQLMGRTVGSTA